MTLRIPPKDRKEISLPLKVGLPTGPHTHLNEVLMAISVPRAALPKGGACLRVPVLLKDLSMVLSKAGQRCLLCP